MQVKIETIDSLKEYTEIPWGEEGKLSFPEGQWSRQNPAQAHTLKEEERTILSFFKNNTSLSEGIEVRGPLHMFTKEFHKKRKEITTVYYKNAYYRGDLKDKISFVKCLSEDEIPIEAPVLEDDEFAVDYIFKYGDYTLGLDPFTSTTSKMQFKKIEEKKIKKQTAKAGNSRNHLRGKKYNKEYTGYAGLLDLSYYSTLDKEGENKHNEWLTRLIEGKEYEDYPAKKVLKENIFVVAVYENKNFYLYGKKGENLDDLKFFDEITLDGFKELAATVGNQGK